MGFYVTADYVIFIKVHVLIHSSAEEACEKRLKAPKQDIETVASSLWSRLNLNIFTQNNKSCIVLENKHHKKAQKKVFEMIKAKLSETNITVDFNIFLFY